MDELMKCKKKDIIEMMEFLAKAHNSIYRMYCKMIEKTNSEHKRLYEIILESRCPNHKYKGTSSSEVNVFSPKCPICGKIDIL